MYCISKASVKWTCGVSNVSVKWTSGVSNVLYKQYTGKMNVWCKQFIGKMNIYRKQCIGKMNVCCKQCISLMSFFLLIKSCICGETSWGKNRRSSEIQGTALGKSLRAWTCIYTSMPAGVVQSRHAFVGGTVSTWARWRIPVNKRQKRHQKCRSNAHCSRGTCRSDSRFPQLVV